MKVLVIGIDGANLDLIKRWSHEGKLPAFKEILSKGSYGNMESVIPTLTIPAWNCMTTGKNSGKTGCYGFIQKAYGSYAFKLYSSMVKKEEDIWDILNNNGHKVFVFNPANIQAAYRINGDMVAGCLCVDEERLTYPKSLKDELYNKLNYERDITDLKTLGSLSDREHSRTHKQITEKHCNVLFHFLDKEYDFGFFVLNELDRAQHRFWKNKATLLDHYQNIDKKLKELSDKLSKEKKETTIIIVSDHGFENNDKVFHINEWLSKRGYLKTDKKPVISSIKKLISIIKKPFFQKITRPLMTLSITRRLYQPLFLSTGKMHIDWKETKAFSYASFGQIYINLKGREPEGVVDPAEYEKVRDGIINGLKELSIKAHRYEEIYHGEYLKLSPDIVIETNEKANSISSRVGFGTEFMEGFGGAHDRFNSTFIAYGPNIKENNEINVNILDVVPTILHIYGMPIPKDLDGKVLKDIFKMEIKQAKAPDKSEKNSDLSSKIKELKHLRKI